jgi:hypothetical protein
MTDPFSISPDKLHILRHTIGYDDNGGDRYPHARSLDERRNYYVTSPAGKDGKLCQELCAEGCLLDRGVWTPGEHLYQITDAGRAVVNLHKTIAPKLTPGQRRYRRFLEADSGMSFKEWLKHG